MLKKVLIAVAVIVLLLVIVIAVQPADFRIARDTIVAAPAEAAFSRVNDFHNWPAWSPWENIDPDLKRTYDGPTAGKGASYAWSGNSDVGEGKMTILESRPDELIRIDLQFIRPFAATNATEFTFEPQGDNTKVTWTMTGKNGFVAKAFGLLMNMDKMVGGDFEKGLASLKQVAEKEAQD
ncbi:MAG: SRPBCC family protein [Pirellulales bacterium]